MKYKELYLTGVKKLEEAGIEEASLDARLLLEYVCHTDRNTLLVHPDMEVSDECVRSYVNSIKQREKRVPLQHITNTQCFMGLDFYVNQDVLIPRQDTENLVEEVMPHVHDGMAILDVCTGSGCILISLLQYSNDCKGMGIDLSEKALAVAKKNAGKILAEKDLCVDFLQGDLFEALSGREEKYDIIVSNPPYIPTAVIDELEPEVKLHDPMMALDGKEDGLYFYRKIVAGAGKYLTRGGKLFFEIGYDQGEAVSNLLKDAGYTDIEIKQDYAGLDRVVFGTLLED
ncbi:MAG: peptide chain release factor N(5)-glutamine methyltransferase [Lachnospiraceae bacterium]|nr:peptide chain release factor N(5)-glutamine methyltransferase [Lachnospiraceae bacterium]